jgi:peptide/nickel transport system permease protein
MSFFFFVLRRLALLVPTLFGVSVIGFLLTYLLPGNPALVKAGPMAAPQYVAEMKHRMGLDQRLHVQYARYVNGLLHGDLGQSSSTGRPVLTDFAQRLPATFELTVASLVLALVIGVPMGVLCAIRRDTIIDHFGRIFSIAGVAIPSFWSGLILIYVFFYLLGIAPAPLGRLGSGIGPPTPITGLYTIDSLASGNWRAFESSLAHLALPSLTLAISVMAPLARMVRAAMLEILETDYIKTAWAAGLPRWRILYGDALTNAIIPLVTALSLIFGFLMAGNAVVESVFDWPGIGNYAVKALMLKDPSPIQSFVLFVALTCVLVNLLVDLIYGIADPRIRIG